MTDISGRPWPFALSLRFSAMGLLAVVLSTFVDGFACVALLAAAAAMTTVAVVSFVNALRKEREAGDTESAPSMGEPRSKEHV